MAKENGKEPKEKKGMMKMIRKSGECDRWFYNGASNWRTEKYPAEAEGSLSSPSPFGSKYLSFCFQIDDLRPVPWSS
jgi:hypothetical protein